MTPSIAAESLFDPSARARLEALLPDYVAARRWFRSKARAIARVTLEDAFPIPFGDEPETVALFAIARVSYADGGTDRYLMAFAIAEGAEAERLLTERPHLVVARLEGATPRVVHDPLGNERFLPALLRCFLARTRIEAAHGALVFRAATHLELEKGDVRPQPVLTEQTNTSVVFGTTSILKLLRQIDEGTSADLEMGEFLTAHGYASAPQVLGAIELELRGAPLSTVGILHRFVPNRGDAWSFSLGELDSYFDRAAAGDAAPVGPYLELAATLGKRVAEMHRVLASEPSSPGFSLEPLDRDARARLVASAREALRTALAAARPHLPPGVELLPAIDARLGAFVDVAEAPLASRVHGDLHLGQILFTGDDFVIVDFEGEPARPLAERKAKRSPLADVAGMLRSFHYAPAAALKARAARGLPPPPPASSLAWYRAVTDVFLRSWLELMSEQRVLPRNQDSLMTALDFYVFEKCIYEVLYEANNRPDWIAIPLEGLTELLAPSKV